ncbi:MAG TPA: hypothetical protein VKK79_06890 [Candidatus Lokiarchaeia archaeon]|nr:hypothetical protein [Candidatus Lokiarchaeia archaeon]
MNLIPTTPGPAPNYWCTWNLQEALANQSNGTENIRNILSEEFLLGESGWAKNIFPQIRGDLYLLLDDGWDIPRIPDTTAALNKQYLHENLSSFVLDESKWPSFTGTPAQRLALLNTAIQSEGWKGIGVWVAAQEASRYKFHHNWLQKKYWQQRVEWSHQAGISYWKVDWGMKCLFKFFRRMLSNLGKRVAPAILVEHAPVVGPFNQKESTGRVSPRFIKRTTGFLAFGDVVRLYDVCFDLGKATMIDRLCGTLLALQQHPNQVAHQPLLHVEDEVYLAAASGCTMGVMRHPLRPLPVKMEEVVRAVRWHRLAPPFGALQQPITCDTKILFDSWFFPPGSFWDKSVINKTIRQGAPARLTRGLPLHSVSCTDPENENEPPFVVASQNPNGTLSIATLGRTNPERGYFTPKVNITLTIPRWDVSIGVFGEYNLLSFRHPSWDTTARVLVQDIGSDEAEDVTKEVTWKDSELQVPGDLLHRIGTSANPEGDSSEPGIVLKIVPP